MYGCFLRIFLGAVGESVVFSGEGEEEGSCSMGCSGEGLPCFVGDIFYLIGRAIQECRIVGGRGGVVIGLFGGRRGRCCYRSCLGGGAAALLPSGWPGGGEAGIP